MYLQAAYKIYLKINFEFFFKNFKCVIPRNIHTYPEEGYNIWKISRYAGGGDGGFISQSIKRMKLKIFTPTGGGA